MNKIIRLISITGVLGLSNLMVLNSVNAYSVTFSNGDFQDVNDTLSNGTGWEGIGSTDIRGTYSNVAPYPNDVANTLQGVITTACPNTIQTGECTDDDGDSLPRNDDSPTGVGTFNLRDQDQIGATGNVPNLQTDLGLSANAFSIPREIGNTPLLDSDGNILYRTPKEGSAIFQDITIGSDGDPNNFILTFNWDFLTNDGGGSLGDKDFGFVSITNTASGYEQLIVLEDSTGTIPTSSGTDFATNTNPYQAYIDADLSLNPGTYRVGFGVIDVDGVGNSSALLVDNFMMEEVPFEFSPTAGLGVVFGFIAFNKLRRRIKK